MLPVDAALSGSSLGSKSGVSMAKKAVLAGLAAGVILALGGCATQAQKQAVTISTRAQAIDAQGKACQGDVFASPAAAMLMVHAPRDPAQPTLQQLADTSFPDDAQVAAIYQVHDGLALCRKQIIDGYITIAPGIASLMMTTFQQSDAEVLQLVQKKINWATYNGASQALAIEYRQKALQESQRIVTALNQENQAELAQRAQALQAFADYMQRQQAINAANRPIVTNCNHFGNQTTCTTN